jgi:hypothetical protein
MAGMAGTDRPYRATSQVKLSAVGYGVTTVTCPAGVAVDVARISVSTTETSTTIVQPQCNLYDGPNASPNAFLEGTFSGNSDSSDTPHNMISGDSVTAEWIGGTPNSTATLRLTGVQRNA